MKFTHLIAFISLIVLSTGCVSTRSTSSDHYSYLTLSGMIDGSEKFIFTKEGIQWIHLHWSPPTEMKFQNDAWRDLRKTPAKWQEFASYDISKASIVKRKGRDVIALEHIPDGFVLYLSDSPNGADRYSVTIAIPRDLKE